MTDRERALIEVSREAFRYFKNRLDGTGRNGMYDDIQIARSLDRVLREYADVPAVRDVDQQFPIPSYVSEDAAARFAKKG